MYRWHHGECRRASGGGATTAAGRSRSCPMPSFGRNPPDADTIAAAALKLAQSAGDLMPCFQLAISATEFAAAPVAQHKSIQRFFALNASGSARSDSTAAVNGPSPAEGRVSPSDDGGEAGAADEVAAEGREHGSPRDGQQATRGKHSRAHPGPQQNTIESMFTRAVATQAPQAYRDGDQKQSSQPSQQNEVQQERQQAVPEQEGAGAPSTPGGSGDSASRSPPRGGSSLLLSSRASPTRSRRTPSKAAVSARRDIFGATADAVIAAMAVPLGASPQGGANNCQSRPGDPSPMGVNPGNQRQAGGAVRTMEEGQLKEAEQPLKAPAEVALPGSRASNPSKGAEIQPVMQLSSSSSGGSPTRHHRISNQAAAASPTTRDTCADVRIPSAVDTSARNVSISNSSVRRGGNSGDASVSPGISDIGLGGGGGGSGGGISGGISGGVPGSCGGTDREGEEEVRLDAFSVLEQQRIMEDIKRRGRATHQGHGIKGGGQGGGGGPPPAKRGRPAGRSGGGSGAVGVGQTQLLGFFRPKT